MKKTSLDLEFSDDLPGFDSLLAEIDLDFSLDDVDLDFSFDLSDDSQSN